MVWCFGAKMALSPGSILCQTERWGIFFPAPVRGGVASVRGRLGALPAPRASWDAPRGDVGDVRGETARDAWENIDKD